MSIPSIDNWIDIATKKVDVEGYVHEVEEILSQYGLKNSRRAAYSFAVIELWKKATTMDWVKPYADIIALRPYVTIIEELKEKIGEQK